MSAVSKSYTFTPGTDIESAEVNQNFDDLVNYTNSEVIVRDGSKAFTAIPSGPGTDPTSDNQFARKKYVDDKSAAAVTAAGTAATTALNAAALVRPTFSGYSGVLNGTAPTLATTQFLMKAGTSVITNSGTISFDSPFPNGLVSVVVSIGGGVSTDIIRTSSETKSGFGCQGWVLSGGAWSATPGAIRVNWIAIGW